MTGKIYDHRASATCLSPPVDRSDISGESCGLSTPAFTQRWPCPRKAEDRKVPRDVLQATLRRSLGGKAKRMLPKSSDGAGVGAGGRGHMRLLRGTEGAGHEALAVPCRHDGTLHVYRLILGPKNVSWRVKSTISPTSWTWLGRGVKHGCKATSWVSTFLLVFAGVIGSLQELVSEFGRSVLCSQFRYKGNKDRFTHQQNFWKRRFGVVLRSVWVILKSPSWSRYHTAEDALSAAHHRALLQSCFWHLQSFPPCVLILLSNSYLQKVRQMTKTETCPEADMVFLTLIKEIRRWWRRSHRKYFIFYVTAW